LVDHVIVHHANHSLFMCSLDPDCEEPELEAQAEQAEEANPELEQGMFRCITPQSLTLFDVYLYVEVGCALGWQELIGP
jgi:hypothetical protein